MSDDTSNHSHDLVVVGSSAAGVGALSTLVSTLHKNFPAPIVIAQHLDPQRPSHLGSILERRSILPILTVDERSPTPLETGKIYVVPSNRHVKVSDGHVHLEADRTERPKPSVDMLLSTATESYGEHLIAVILTGAGSDGAAGAVEVKNPGGTVIIQNPQTAPYPSMPLSLPPTTVDHVVEMEQIGRFLFDILTGINLPPTDKVDDPLRELLTQASAQTNIDFRNYKSSTILRLNQAYKKLFGNRDALGLPLSEVLSGHDVDHLLKLVKRSLREAQAIQTPAINATVAGADDLHSRLSHTIVPIPDETGGNVNRLFIYSEKPVEATLGEGLSRRSFLMVV